MIRLEMKNCIMILTERQQNHHYHHYLTGKEILSFNQRQIVEQDRLAHYPLGNKAIQKQIEKHVDAKKSLDISNKDEFQQTESIFPLNMMNDMIHAKF